MRIPSNHWYEIDLYYERGDSVRYEQFYPEDKVITIVEYNHLPVGSVGKVMSRWSGTAYTVKLSDGSYRWLSDYEVGLIETDRRKVNVGDTIVVTSNDHQHQFANIGDKFKVTKVAYDVDYYKVMIDGKTHWLGGFQLAPHE